MDFKAYFVKRLLTKQKTEINLNISFDYTLEDNETWMYIYSENGSGAKYKITSEKDITKNFLEYLEDYILSN